MEKKRPCEKRCLGRVGLEVLTGPFFEVKNGPARKAAWDWRAWKLRNYQKHKTSFETAPWLRFGFRRRQSALQVVQQPLGHLPGPKTLPRGGPKGPQGVPNLPDAPGAEGWL